MSVIGKHTTAAPGTDRNPVCHCLAIRQAARRITQLYDHALAPIGLRGTQFSILAVLHDAGPIGMRALAQRMVMDRATLGHNLRPLEAQGLVGRTVGTDRRSRLVTLTTAGRDRLEAARPLWRQAQRRFEQSFGKDAARDLHAVLSRVAALDFEGPADSTAGP